MIKKSITGFLSCMFCLCFLDSVKVESAVIEPEIVKTETWTTSYIVSTPESKNEYPFVEVTAYIYNDGYICVYGENTHDWSDNEADMIATLKQSIPYSELDVSSMFDGKGFYVNRGDYEYHGEINYLIDCDISYYPNSYWCDAWGVSRHTPKEPYVFTYMMCDASHEYVSTINTELNECTVNIRFPQRANISQLKKGTMVFLYEFRPLSVISKEKFHLFGHDITITPELLSGNIVEQPELTEQEKYIKQLEEENAKLKTENEHYKETLNTDKDQIIKNLESEKEMLEDTLYQYKLIDYNGNGKLDVDDSQMILMYYVNTLAGKYTGTIEDYVLYRNDKAYESVHISGGI